MKYQYIENFQKLGFGLFIHFGLYSVIGKGEWYQAAYQVPFAEYKSTLAKFKVKNTWARDLVLTAKKAGFKYITITTRHHDGFSLYDTCGLSDFDAPHSASKRDLIKEFVDECHKADIKPFFYHTLIDWNYQKEDYQQYLLKSLKLLCQNYGDIGGFWFDGSWDEQGKKLDFDLIYKTIRKYQPNAMIINNTGLSELGKRSHTEIDAVTFERGKAFPVLCEDKPIAGEVCDGITDHWGYAKNDICYKSVPYLIEELVDARSVRCNLLLNTGLRGDGSINPMEKYTLLELGKWVKANQKIIFDCVPSHINADNAFIFEDKEYYYALMKNVPMSSNEHVTREKGRQRVVIHSDKKICSIKYIDTNFQKVEVNKKDNSFEVLPFPYGNSFSIRVARFKLK